MPGRLKDKVALITGTGGGQGRAAALLFAREGAKVVGCGRNVKNAEETVEMVRAAGGEMVSAQPVDLSDNKQVKEWVDFAVKTYGRIDILYNNASACKFVPIEKMSFEDWSYTIRNELDLIYSACHYAWPYLKVNGGVIINTSSVAGMLGNAGSYTSAHSATKGGVIAMTRQLAAEGGPHGIRANVLSPGIIVTPGTKAHLQNPEINKSLMKPILLGRFGEAEEMAKVALFLASDDSSYVTGANIMADGGVTAAMAH